MNHSGVILADPSTLWGENVLNSNKGMSIFVQKNSRGHFKRIEDKFL